ncbi:MAG: DNA polymerase III subunit delta [Bacteroidetes bacterium]|nr:DNA polymerase III subunit delta [Bacteroidota bacterium]
MSENNLDFQKIMQDLKNKRFAPIYILSGDEFYFIDEISDYIEKNALTDAEKGFNQMVVYAKDTEIKQVVESARRFPMMANHQVIILKEAQVYKNLDDFEQYLEKPVPSTILVINLKGKKLDKRTKLYKFASKHIIFESKKLYENQLPKWIMKYLSDKGFSINEKSAALIADSLGSDLSKISNELEKLLINKNKDKTITDADVEANIGISREFNSFELISAICARNTARSFYINQRLSKSKEFSIIPFLTQLCNLLSKSYILSKSKASEKKAIELALGLNYFQAQDVSNVIKNYTSDKIERMLRLCAEYDLKSKGIGSATNSDSALMQELLVKIF